MYSYFQLFIIQAEDELIDEPAVKINLSSIGEIFITPVRNKVY